MDELWVGRIDIPDGGTNGYIAACEDEQDARNVFATLANDLEGDLIDVTPAVDALDGNIMELCTF